MKTLTRDERKEILKPRPSGEFLQVLEQVYAITEINISENNPQMTQMEQI